MEDVWIVDPGITSNMTNRQDHVKNYTEKRSTIRVAKVNKFMTARGSGLIEFEN